MVTIKEDKKPNIQISKLPYCTYLITVGTHSILLFLDVKGEATEASASDSEIPACAIFNAPQSLAPSPHMAT